MTGPTPTACQPLKWIPTLYLAEGFPYALVSAIVVLVYHNLGLTNADATAYVGALGLPWIIKPLWGPLVEFVGTRRQWIWQIEMIEAALIAAAAFSLFTPHFVPLTFLLFLALGFCSATHDIAADGFYLLALPEHQQAAFSGVRNTSFRVAMLGIKGGLVILVGKMLQVNPGHAAAWRDGLLLVSFSLLAFGLYHRWILPRPAGDVKRVVAPSGTTEGASTRLVPAMAREFGDSFASFFKKPGIGLMLAFILLYRLGEAQLMAVAQLFLLADRAQGGLGLAQADLGWIYGTFGVIALLLGGLLGGWAISRKGLKFWLWPMLFAIHLPDAVFIWLAHAQPTNLYAVGAGVVMEQFGYGFGFSAFMLYLIYIARGSHQTSHYALCTGFMALGLALPGLISGRLQEYFGYEHFFIWVLLATIPSFIVSLWLPLDPAFGQKR